MAKVRASGRVPQPSPAWPAFRQLRVTKVVPESDNVFSIYLAAPDGTALPTARPGQYLTLRVSGAADPPPVRSYSLSWTAGAGTYRISVKRESHGTVSSYLNRSLQPGAVLDVAAPRGDFILADGTGPVLLMSAGIGVTPVLSMLYQLAKQKSEREVWWLYGARGPREHPFAAEAHALLASLPRAREHVFYSAATPAQGDRVHAADGRLTGEALAGLDIPADATAYICGPTSLMADMQGALTTVGLGATAIHTELFGALPSINPGISGQASKPPHQPPGPPGTGPRVTFARSGITVPFRDDWGNVLQPGRRLRRPHPVELPDRRLPHLHDAASVRRHHLQPRPSGTTRRRGRSHLLRPARHRYRRGSVGGEGPNAEINPGKSLGFSIRSL